MTDRIPIRQRVLEALRARPLEQYCTTCLSRLLGTPETTVQLVTMKLESTPGLRRAYGSCSSCGNDRIVVGSSGATDGGRA